MALWPGFLSAWSPSLSVWLLQLLALWSETPLPQQIIFSQSESLSFCLFLLPYCAQTVPSPTSTPPASERTPKVRWLTSSPALKGLAWGKTSWLYNFLCLQNSASDFPPLPSALVTVLWLDMPCSQVHISSYTSLQTTEVTWERELTLYFISQKCSHTLGKQKMVNDSIVTVSQLKLFNRLQSCLSLWYKMC